jgi:hypothetical protein
MVRVCAGAIALASSVGCLGPLESDVPGYSRHVLPAGSEVPLARDDYETNHKIDEADGLDEGAVPLVQGFAQGRVVHYWDLGVAKSSIAPAYYLTRCDHERKPVPNQAIAHPWIWASVPGDPDYSPFRALAPVCVTDRYAGEVIDSPEALSDAIDMKLVREPAEPIRWRNLPVIAAGVLAEAGLTLDAAYAGARRVDFLSFASQEGDFPFVDKRIAAKNVYELSFEGSEKVEQVVFAHGLFDEAGQRNAAYFPAWKRIAVVLASDADLSQFDRESAIVSIDAEGKLKPAQPAVKSAKAAGDTVNRPHQALLEEGLQ